MHSGGASIFIFILILKVFDSDSVTILSGTLVTQLHHLIAANVGSNFCMERRVHVSV